MRSTEHSPSSGPIRITILLATVAALLLVPAAQAFAAGFTTVEIVGSGKGEVSSVNGLGEVWGGAQQGSPAIECTYASPGPVTGTCKNESGEDFFEGDWLRALPAPGSEFAGWTIVEGHRNATVLPGEEDKEANCRSTPGNAKTTGPGSETQLEALFGPEAFNGPPCSAEPEEFGGEVVVRVAFESGEEPEGLLTVSKEGAGEGTVTSTPVGIDCGSECEAEFEEGEEVELSQSAETGSEFTGWGGACIGTGSCKVTMSEAKSVTATFDLESETLTVEVEGPGSVGAPEDIDCPGVCAGAYSYGETVTLSAEPDPGAELLEWSGECDSVTGNECEVEMTADKTVEAVFALEPTPEFKLTIVKAGTGSGSVTCNATACAATYPEGEEVTLAATAASDSTFAGWSGAGCSGTGSCVVTIEEDTTVTATFTANSKPEETCATNASLCPPPAEAKCIVPKLAKKSLRQAKSALKAAHCALGKVTKPKKKKGPLVVKSSKPGAGTTLAAGTKVGLKLGPKRK